MADRRMPASVAAAKCRLLKDRLLLTRRLTGSANLPRLLPNAGNLIHREGVFRIALAFGIGSEGGF